MGLFSRITRGLGALVGAVDAEAMRIGGPARAELLEVVPLGTTVRHADGVAERVCEFLVEITAADAAPYRTRVRQRMPEVFLDGPLPSDMSVVAARVHPRDPHRVALDFDAPPPLLRPHLGPHMAAA